MTFDENDSVLRPNRVLTVLYGDQVVPGRVSQTHYTHYSLLRTIEETMGLGTLGQLDRSANFITDVWK